MKQINGTITLSFLEEDNQQRVIFRVVPLCTREGAVFRDKTVEFPDQGSLRIVPDKREQSTFKERMRAMAFATFLAKKEKRPVESLTIALGRDSRISGPALLAATAEGIAATGATAHGLILSLTRKNLTICNLQGGTRCV